jgi:dihydroxyacetone kinase
MYSLQIAGAMVERGKSLTDIAQTVRMVMKVLATYGVSLSACSLPGEQSLFIHKFTYKNSFEHQNILYSYTQAAVIEIS